MFNPVHHHCYPFTDFYKNFTYVEPKPFFTVRQIKTTLSFGGPVCWSFPLVSTHALVKHRDVTENRFFAIMFQKKILLYIFVLVVKQPIQIILKFFASSQQMIMFIHVVFVLVGIVIYFCRNLLLIMTVFIFVFLIVLMKRIEKTKNRVKSNLEVTINAIDSKHIKIESVLNAAEFKRKKL